MKVQRSNEIHKSAILKNYNRRCGYCNQEIKKVDGKFIFQIDHIICEDMRKKTSNISEILDKYDLPLSFDFQGYENAIPAHVNCNRLKNNYTYENILIKPILDIASNRKTKIIADIKNLSKLLKDEEKIDKTVALLSEYVSTGKVNLDHLFHNIVKEKPVFKRKEETIDGYDKIFYRKSLDLVEISAFIPKSTNGELSCCFDFKSFRISDCSITLGTDQIMNVLFKGVGDKKPTNRGIVISESSFNDSETTEGYIIQLPHNRFVLSSQETCELMQIIDSFYNQFIKFTYENEEKISGLEYINYKNGYYLGDYDCSSWDIIKSVINEKIAIGEYMIDIGGHNSLVIENRTKSNYTCVQCIPKGERISLLWRQDWERHLNPELDESEWSANEIKTVLCSIDDIVRAKFAPGGNSILGKTLRKVSKIDSLYTGFSQVNSHYIDISNLKRSNYNEYLSSMISIVDRRVKSFSELELKSVIELIETLELSLGDKEINELLAKIKTDLISQDICDLEGYVIVHNLTKLYKSVLLRLNPSALEFFTIFDKLKYLVRTHNETVILLRYLDRSWYR